MNLTSARILNASDVNFAADRLRSGQLVAFPTETVYGLGGDATNSLAVAGIFETKQRPHFDPLIVHVANAGDVDFFVADFPVLARKLANEFWPGPLTLVLPKRDVIPDLVTAGLAGVGIRVPAHPLARELIQQAGCPVAAPSANLFGRISPTTAQHVLDGLGDRIDFVLDGGPCSVGLESTIVSFVETEPIVLRYGGLAVEQIEAVIGRVAKATPNATRDDAAQPAPGMLSRHYAPRTALILTDGDQVAKPIPRRRCGLLTCGDSPHSGRFDRIERLSDTGDLKVAAAGFFAALRSLDSAGLDVIIAHCFPETGLGMAINDRLRRAAKRD